MFYVCTKLANDVCQHWEKVSFPILEKGEGLKFGALFLLCSITAWGFREVYIFIVNRK